MGSCESKNNTPEANKIKKSNKINKNIKIEESIKINEKNNKNDRLEECIIQNTLNTLQTSSPFEKIDHNLTFVSKSICKIKIETKLKTIIGTGFLLNFNIDQERFYCLISNEHVIKNNIIQNNSNSKIYISYDNEKRHTNIKLGNKKRYIKSFIDIGLDITTTETLDEDNISKDYFLYPEYECWIYNELINNMIYIPQYARGEDLVNARGEIKNINKYEFTHLANTEEGSSGSPIFLENSIDVIGIHKGGNKDKTENYGDFIYPAIDIIENDIREKRNKGKYINGKYIWEDDKYYIGEFRNNIPNGKGIKYYSNGNILYEGYFINGKFEGNGKYIYDDGRYYIGQYKNGLRNGIGKIYYKNGNIQFEGNFINDEYEGNGKYIWEDGEYYIGQYKNGLRNGKGIYYYSNRKIKYEGDFINGKFEGNGKYIWEDGEYYIGQYKNDLRNGKGIEYYSNGKIKYEGNFINGVYAEF